MPSNDCGPTKCDGNVEVMCFWCLTWVMRIAANRLFRKMIAACLGLS